MATRSPDRPENMTNSLALRAVARVATVEIRRCLKDCDE
jgi:hypothetical protein